MEFEEQKRIVRKQRAGYAALRQFEIDQMRKATFVDRLEAFKAIMEFAEHMNWTDSREDDNLLAQRWRGIRTRYDAANR